MPGALLSRLCARARAEWPELGVVRDAELEAFMLARIPAERLDLDVRAEDLLLACACAKGILAAHDLLRERIEGDIDRVHTRIRPPISLPQARQLIEKRLFTVPEGGVAMIALYKGDIDLAGYVRNVTSRVLLGLASRTKQRPDSIEDCILQAVAPNTARSPTDADLERVMRNYLAGLRVAMTHAVASLDPRERALLRYAIVDQLGPEALGLMYAVSAETMATWLRAARAGLEFRLKHRVAERLRVADRDHGILVRFVSTQLDVLFKPLFNP
jgi:RNA polymerase sigma-70 factor